MLFMSRCIARHRPSGAKHGGVLRALQEHAEDEDVDFVHMMAERMTQRVYKRGEIVYHKGDAAEDMCFVFSGVSRAPFSRAAHFSDGAGAWLQAADIYLENPPEGEEDSMTEAELGSIKARLLEMRPRALTRRAEELGISDDKLDVADEATDRKEALISLILDEQQQARKERGISMSRLESAGHDAEHAVDAAVSPHSLLCRI